MLNQAKQRSRHPEAHNDNHHSQTRDRVPLPTAHISRREIWILAENQIGNVHEKASEDQHEKGDEENRQHRMASAEPRAQNRELTLEEAEGRRARNRKRHHEKCSSGQWHRMNQATLGLLKQLGVQMLLHISGTKE